MAVTVKTIIPSKFAENVDTTQYTSTNGKCIIDKFTAYNSGAAEAWLTIYLVNPADTAGASNTIIYQKAISPKQTITINEIVGHNLELNGFIATIASAVSTVSIRASGREIT